MIAAALAAVLAASVSPSDAALDLTPYFRSGPAAQAKTAFDAGRYAEAAAKLAREGTPEARLLRAMALVEAGRAAEAVEPLAALEARLPDAADRIALLRGRALEAAGAAREALASFAAVPDGSLVSGEARLARARLARRLGERALALDALAPLVSSPPPEAGAADLGAAALLLAGRIAGEGERPDPAAARRAFSSCWADHPLAREAGECLAALRGLPAPHGGEPGVAEQVRRAEALLEANLNEAAAELLRRAVPELAAAAPGEDLACRARAALGRAHRKTRSYADAVEALRPVVESCDDPSVRVRALYLVAGATANTGDKEGAVALYRRLARDYPRHTLADDALFFAADLLLRAEREGEAREALAAIVRDHRGGDHWDEARFRLAWLARRAGDHDGAVAQLLAIEESERELDPYEHARAAYWRARILSARGEAGARAAQAIWADLSARYPGDYYGLLARARLAGGADGADVGARAVPASAQPRAGAPSIVPAVIGPQPAWRAGPLAADAHFRAGVLLLRMGFPREASAELAAVEPLRLADPDAPDAALVVADLLDRAGDHRNAHQLLRTRARVALRQVPSSENLRAWRIAYPPAFRDHVQRWAPPAGVPVELLQALMREESALDPRAVSPVGAVGLTQLMLPTAREVARQLKLRRPSRADLMDGALNIRIGARYLGQLLRRFDGRVALALAAYNAGGGAVSRWLEARGDLELDEFVEEIPYEETRGYVKRVLRSYAAYRLLYGDGAPAEGLFRVAGR
ncbi:transglycosylase SLT domain-containing protein [Anaeromyxobacter sp. Fw109-5]|uniref:transglycosylase SLT domain-containing protein n=1 Tax=Anaeromyxobacter sp. (strain Fw109-5) TaxID=404589 RepID=UPI000158A4AC|nr:transglycosylase SLT domain-containing protein [Anaeromyxobacter sp. Fw109-5]ABS26156.1 Lytic transglycosylase catalytic [Anaeromyxobacter sp. Fw109-5]